MSDEMYKALMVAVIAMMAGVIVIAVFSFIKYPEDKAMADIQENNSAVSEIQ
jgi:hypothetical protein